MNQILVTVPEYYKRIAALLNEADWFVHNFPEPNLNDLYNPANYLYNCEFEKLKYRALLDLNVLQFIVNCIKKDKANPNNRIACAFLVFCRLCEFEIEPNLAIYERINYNAENLEEALTELQLLRSLDNADVDDLARYALGLIDNLPNVAQVSIDRDTIGHQLIRYRKLTNWDSIYLLALGAVTIYLDNSIKQTHKLEHYVDWMVREYRLSLPCIVYAARLFGHNPMPNMMKYRPHQSAHLRRTACFNMTWDLFHIDYYFKAWVGDKTNYQTILFTGDNGLRSVLRLAIATQQQEELSPTKEFIGKERVAILQTLIDSRHERTDRVYGTEAWNPEYRKCQIERFEKKLFS